MCIPGKGPETVGTKQGDWSEGRHRPRKLTLYTGFKLPKCTTLSLNSPMRLSASTFLSNKLLTLYLLPP